MLHAAVARVRAAAPRLVVLVALTLLSTPALAASGVGLDAFVGKVRDFNTELIALGAVLAVTGFIWALLGLLLGVAGTAKAVMVLATGLCIAAAPQIVSIFIPS